MERKRELMRLYDQTAQIYDARYTEIQRRKYELVLEFLPSDIQAILDVGCGSGLLLQELLGRSKLLVGIDFSLRMLDTARRKVREAQLILADAEALPFRENSFDCVVSITLLQNVPSPQKAVGECARVLKEKGVLILTTLKHKHSQDELQSLVEESGMYVVECGAIPQSEDVFCVAQK